MYNPATSGKNGPAIDVYKRQVSIYYRRDYVIGEAYWRRHGTRLEPELAASAETVRDGWLHTGDMGSVSYTHLDVYKRQFVLVGFDGIDAREDHRLHVLESGDRFPCGVRHLSLIHI